MSCMSKISTLDLHKVQLVVASPGKKTSLANVLVNTVLVKEAREVERFQAKIFYMLIDLLCFDVKNYAILQIGLINNRAASHN